MKTLSNVLEQALFALHDTDMITWAEYYTEGNEIIIELDDYAGDSLYLTGSIVNDEIVILGLEHIKTVTQIVDFINTWRDTHYLAEKLDDVLTEITAKDRTIIAEYELTENYLWVHCFDEDTENTLALEGLIKDGMLIVYDVSGGLNGVSSRTSISTPLNILEYVNAWELDFK